MAEVDYTKYRLKPKTEIKEIFKEVSSIFVISCKKCYKEFDVEIEPEGQDLSELLGEERHKISGCAEFDFLCNNHLTKKKLTDLNISDVEAIGVISCGIGVQLVAQELEDRKRVLTLTDSVSQSANTSNFTGYHGISLNPEKCAACAQCYLNITGGICPVVNCAKGLLNGPCGGAKDGKCEVNSQIDCAWEKIYLRLKEQGRNLPNEVKFRDYGKFTVDEKNKISLSAQTRRMQNFYGGIFPLERKKATESLPIETFPEPKHAVIFLSQHIGSPASPLVKPGSEVKVGQKIGGSSGFVSAPVHASISGKVLSIEERVHPSLLKPSPAIIIENDGLNSVDPSVKPVLDWENIPKESLLELLKGKGIVGLGGAMFPTHVKLSSPKPVDALVVNGCECEPYLNADNRVMIEHPEKISKGIKIVQKVLEVKNVIIGVEENKPEAVENLKRVSLTVASLKTKYPQGAEKMLVKKLLNRQVPEGGFPFDVGVVVLNVSTIFAIYQAIFEGLPLVERVITISGDGLKRKGNFLIKIGMPLEDIMNFCFDGSRKKLFEEYQLKMGGPMMGISQADLASGVIKGTTGFTILRKHPVEISEERECIKCGRCVEVCPMELYPLYYAYYGKKGMWAEALKYNVENCIECGCCEYVCSSKIDLLSFIKKAKRYAYNKAKG